VTVVVPSTTTFFFSLVLAVTPITLPLLIVSVTINLSTREQVAPVPPVQLTTTLAFVPPVVAPLTVALPAPPPGMEGAVGLPAPPEPPPVAACTTAVCGDSTVAPSPLVLDASSRTRIVDPTSAAPSVYEEPVAPEISEQPAPVAFQRSHCSL
jgi:hypothetical protein